MNIKRMSYNSISGGTFTIYMGEDNKLKEKNITLPEDINDFNSLLTKRIGEPIENITFQIDESQHLSEERIIVNYKTNPDTHRNTKKIINISEMNFYEKLRYERIKTQAGA